MQLQMTGIGKQWEVDVCTHMLDQRLDGAPVIGGSSPLVALRGGLPSGTRSHGLRRRSDGTAATNDSVQRMLVCLGVSVHHEARTSATKAGRSN